MLQRDKVERAVVSALEKHAPAVERTGRSRWGFSLANGSHVGFTARLDEEWLVMRAELNGGGDGETRTWWELLCLNAQLEGSPRFVLRGQANLVGLGAEIPIDEDSDVRLRVHEACNAFKCALEYLHAQAGSPSEWQSKVASVTNFAPPAGFDLKALCEQTGWPFNQREDGSVAFDLQTRAGFHQAQVRVGGQGSVSVSAELAEGAVLPAVSQQAISLMLLQASHFVRGVCALAELGDNTVVWRLATGFSSPPSARELEHALTALAVACDLCGQETTALQDERVAESYLSLRGWAGKSRGLVSESTVALTQASVIAA